MTADPVANRHVIDTGTPPIPEAGAWLTRYQGGQGPALRLSQAAPGLPPPSAMLTRLADAAGNPASTTYGPICGEPDLVEIYAGHISEIYRAPIPAAEIAITTGCNQAFIVALMAIAKAGDAVVLPEPWYFNHQMTLQMFGIECRPLPCRAEHGFVPDVAEARAAIARGRVRAIVLVTPNNPTGAIYPPAVIMAFAELARETGCWLILDETYRDFLTAAGARPHALFNTAELAANIVQLYSFSKSYALPGHRIGALRAPPALMPQINKILDCLQICAPRVGQMALTWAIPNLAAWREANRADIVDRANAFKETIRSSRGWMIRSIGAYFAYVEHPFGGVPAQHVAQRLAEQCGILALPGTFFGGATQSPYLRLAFANADCATIAGVGARLAALRDVMGRTP
jgi:aspartate/methionine/tyrosine aminotransferase